MTSYGEQHEDTTLDLELVHAFQGALDLPPHRVYNLPDLSAHVDHKGDLKPPAVKLADGLFIDRSVLDVPTAAPDAKPDAFGFILKAARRAGREKSRNKVFFGDLIVNWLDQEHSDKADVAVKPGTDRDLLLGELAMLQYMQNIGIPTFKPTGFLLNKEATHSHLLTEFRGHVETIDTWDWNSMSIGEQWEMFGFSVEAAALLNSELLFHRDLHPRNIATDELNKLVIVDPEFTVSALELAYTAMTTEDDMVRAWATDEIKNLMSYELGEICKSVHRFIFNFLPEADRPADANARFKEYTHHILKPYREALISRESIHLPVLLDAYELMLIDLYQSTQEGKDIPTDTEDKTQG